MTLMEPIQETLEFVRRVARDAGALVVEGAFRAHAADRKRAPTDLVTEYDRRSEQLIVDAIRARWPDDFILAEESGAHVVDAARVERRWLIDPLDGTTNFAHGLPFFCVSIAVEERGRAIAGAVCAPALGWEFSAARGRGAWLGAHGSDRRLRVSETATLDGALLATGFPYDNATSAQNNFAEFIALYQQTHGVRRVGAAALDLAMVAAGWLDGYWEMKLKPWDLAAGALLVEEAGGRTSSYAGGALEIDRGEAIASNGLVHDAIVTALAAFADARPRV
jgi:myo-inositol-1(or 4)-monophosphatase